MNKSTNSNTRRYQSKMPIADKNIGKSWNRGTLWPDKGEKAAARRLKQFEARDHNMKVKNGPHHVEVKVTPRPEDSFHNWPFAPIPRGMRLAPRTGKRPHFAINKTRYAAVKLKQKRKTAKEAEVNA